MPSIATVDTSASTPAIAGRFDKKMKSLKSQVKHIFGTRPSQMSTSSASLSKSDDWMSVEYIADNAALARSSSSTASSSATSLATRTSADYESSATDHIATIINLKETKSAKVVFPYVRPGAPPPTRSARGARRRLANRVQPVVEETDAKEPPHPTLLSAFSSQSMSCI